MKRRTFSTVLGVIVILALVGLGAYYVKNNGTFNPNQIIKDSGSGISDYSAVFLTNGQVYFGKINADTNEEINLSDIYYLQVNQPIQNSGTSTTTNTNSNDNTNVVLVKLGNELHGPNDRMHINKEQVLFTESLKDDSKVITAINNYQNK